METKPNLAAFNEWIKYPEGFDIIINGVTVQFRPKPQSPAHQ